LRYAWGTSQLVPNAAFPFRTVSTDPLISSQNLAATFHAMFRGPLRASWRKNPRAFVRLGGIMSARLKATLRKLKILCQRVARWVRYLYFMRFAILLWAFPLLLVWANSPARARAFVSGIVTPTHLVQYICVAFFLIASGFVALVLSRIVVINGKERFGDDAPGTLEWLLANKRAKYEWIAPVLSQTSTIAVFTYFFVNGCTEQVDQKAIALGLALGTGIALLFWYAVNAFYYLTYRPPAATAAVAGFGGAAARTILFPRSMMRLSSTGTGARAGDALEDASTDNWLSWLSRLTDIFPVAGYRWPVSRELYEGQYFAIIAAIGFFALYWALLPLTAPIVIAGWSFVSLGAYLLGNLVIILIVSFAKPGSAAARPLLSRWKAGLTLAILIVSATIPVLYFASDAERFPILALVLILVISLSWAFGAIAFFADRYRIPVLTSFLLGVSLLRVAGIYGSDEEHYLSIKLLDQKTQLHNPAEILAHKLDQNPGDPLFVVTATGGGIHAAAWTAGVLAELESRFDNDKGAKPHGSFHDHILLLSTVSGGSGGLLTYLRELHEGNFDRAPVEATARMRSAAGCSSLEGVGWGLVYYDIPKAFVPFAPYVWPLSSGVGDLGGSPIGKDRTWALRRAFARNLDDPFCKVEGAFYANSDSATDGNIWKWIHRGDLQEAEKAGDDSAEKLTLTSFDPTQKSQPAFTMNTTTVEGGDRFLSADYQIPFAPPPPPPQGFTPPTAESFLEVYGGARFGNVKKSGFADLPLVTGAQLSATFPYVSSAATIPAMRGMAGVHFVDGGYYDNDGTGSAIEFLRWALDNESPDAPMVTVVLVEIRNSPDTISAPQCCKAWQSNSCPKPWNITDQILAPLHAFYNAGHDSVTGRNRNALDLLKEAYPTRLNLIRVVIADNESQSFVGTDPLNWSLTPAQRFEIAHSLAGTDTDAGFKDVIKEFNQNRNADGTKKGVAPPKGAVAAAN
jgi:hypothetical protein